MRIFSYFFVFVFLCNITQSVQLYKKVLNTVDPNAKCLDGTSPFFYLHQGKQPKKFMIFLIGGGQCSGNDLSSATEDCYLRSKTMLGSSNPWPETRDPTGQGIFETDPSASAFAEWTKVIAGYCDGSLHQGYRKNPISWKGQKLYFRGAANTRALFKWLVDNADLANADKVVLTGSSAGGIGAYLWGNYLSEQLVDPQSLVIIPDSGIFLVYNSYKTGTVIGINYAINSYILANYDQKPPFPICNKYNPGRQYVCLYIEYIYTEIKPQTLLINSEYDSFAINNILLTQCLTQGSSGLSLAKCDQEQIKFIEGYRAKFKQFIEVFLMCSRNNVWTIGCSNHVYIVDDFYYKSCKQTVDGMTVQQAIENFVFKEQRIEIQDGSWPSNEGCSY